MPRAPGVAAWPYRDRAARARCGSGALRRDGRHRAGRAAGKRDRRLRTPGIACRTGGGIVIRCGKCGRENRQGRRFCAGCGTALELKCSQCGASNEPDEDYCGQCGFALVLGSDSAAERQPAVSMVAENPEAQLLEGERKTMTALFADIKDSMELMEA